MKRRAFLLAAIALPAFGQQAGRIYRLGLAVATSLQFMKKFGTHKAFFEALGRFGYVGGQNLVVESRDGEGRPEGFPRLVAELVERKVEVLVVGNDQLAVAAKNATSSIPIVFAAAADPVGLGLVKTLARPGGNVTGIASFSETTISKQLEVLLEAFPSIRRVAVIGSADAATAPLQLSAIREAARRLALDISVHDLKAAASTQSMLDTIARERPDALHVLPTIATFLEHEKIASFANQRRLPAIYGIGEQVQIGGLMSYSISLADNWRRIAEYVDKIFRGTKPADLPVQQPIKFELAINLKTARALGLEIQRSVLIRADRVIE